MKSTILKAASGTVGKLAKVAKPIVRKVKWHSPTILTIGGVGLIIGGTIWMCRSTTKVIGTLDWYDATKYDKEIERENCESEEEKKKISKDIRRLGHETTIEVFKAYAPAIGVEALGITCMLGANHILNKRVVAYAAAAMASESRFRKYRQAVKAELGEEKDEHFLVQDEEIEVEETKVLKNGKEKKISKKLKVIKETGLSQYYVIFDENNCVNWTGSYAYDQAFIMEIENWANAELQHDGVLYLNDVIRRLGIIDPKKHTRYHPDEGQVVGWLKNGDGDGYIWIRMVEFDKDDNPIGMGDNQVNAKYKGFWLDFNVDGAILGKA